MEEIYIVNGEEFSLSSLQANADESEMDLQEYLSTIGAELKGSTDQVEEVEKQEATAEAANTVAIDDAAIQSQIPTALTSESILLDYDTAISEIDDTYTTKVDDINNTSSYSDKFKQRELERVENERQEALNQNNTRKLEQEIIVDSKLGKNDDGTTIHDWMFSNKSQDVKVTDEAFSQTGSELTKTLSEAYPDYEFETKYKTDNPFFSGIQGITGYNIADDFDSYKDLETGILIRDKKTGEEQLIRRGQGGKNGFKTTEALETKKAIVNFIDDHGYDASQYTKRDQEVEVYLNKINEVTSPSEEELTTVEEFVNSEDLFEYKPIEGENYYLALGQDDFIEPYREQKSQAKKLLEAANSLSNSKRSEDNQLPAPTEEEIEETARILIKNEKITSLQDGKWTDFLEQAPEERQAILKYYKAKEQDASFVKVAGLQKLNDIEVSAFESAENPNRIIIDKFEKTYESDSDTFEIEEGDNQFKLANNKIVSEREFQEYIDASKGIQNQYGRLVDRQDRISKETDNIVNIDSQFDLLRRDYDTWNKFTYNVSSGFATIGAGLAYGVGKIAQGGVYLTEEFSGDVNNNAGSGAVGDFLDEKAENFTEMKEKARDSYAKDVSFEKAFDLTDGGFRFGRFMAQEIGQQIPILTTIIASGGTYSPYVIGAYAMGEKYMDMDVQDLRSGEERNELTKFGVSLGYGLSEAVFERLTTVAILKKGQNYIKNAAKTNASGGLFKNVNDGIKQTFKEEWKRIFVADPMLEAGGESLTQMTQNILDGNPLMDNVAHAAFSGAMFGMGMSVAPVMYGMAMAKFQDPKKLAEYQKMQDDILKINKLLSKDNLKPETRKALRDTRRKIQLKADANLNGIMNLTSESMSPDGFRRYNSATSRQQELRNQADEILNDPYLLKEGKTRLLQNLNKDFNNIQHARDIYRNSKTFGNKLALLRTGNESDQSRYLQYEAQATENIRIKRNQSTDFIPESKDINAEMYDLFVQDEILNRISDASSSNGVVVDVKDTNKEAKELIKNAKQIGNSAMTEEQLAAEKKSLIEAIDSGRLNGVDNIDGKSYVFMQNAIKNGRTSTSIHEPGHKVFFEILEDNNADFSSMAKEVRSWLSKFDPEILSSMSAKATNSSDEEFIMEFLEQVDSGNINFEKTSNKKLATIFGFLTGDVMKKNGGYELDLKGQTDAISFLITLAAKLRTGTLSKQDIEDAKDSNVIKKVKADTLNKSIDKTVDEVFKLSLEPLSQADRNIKYKDIFNKGSFEEKDSDGEIISVKVLPTPLTELSKQEYRSMMTDSEGKLTPVGQKLYKNIVQDWMEQAIQVAGRDMELAQQTLSGPFLNHLLAMDPQKQLDTKNPIAAYMGNYLPFKTGDARKQMKVGDAPTGRTIEIDAQVEGRRQFDPVAAEEVNIPEELNFTRQSGVLPGSDMYNAILRANELVVGTKLPKLEYTRKKKGQPDVVVNLKDVRAILKNKDSISRQEFQQAELDYTRIIKDFRNNIAAQYESILYDNIKESLGKSDERLLELKDAVVNKLSIADLVAMERLSKDKIFTRLDKTNLNVNEIPSYEGTGRLVYSNPKSGPNLYTRLDPSPKEFVDFFKKRGRDEALIKNLAKTYGFDGTMQVMTEQDTIDKITNRNPELNYLVADDVIQVMASAIDRGVQSKLSLEVERQFSEIKNPTANNFGIYMDEKDRLIKLLLDTGYNVGFAKDIKKTKGQVRNIVESLYNDKLSKPEITKLVNLYSPLINKFGKQIAEYKSITNFPLKKYIDGSLNADENASLNAFWNLKDKDGKSVNIGNLYTANGRQSQKAFINVSIPQLINFYKDQGKTKLDLAIDFILFKGGFEDGGLDRKMIYGNEAAGDYDTKKQAQEAINNSKYKLGEIKKRDNGKYRVSGGHVEVFNKELLEANFGITSYKSKTKDGVTTWTLEVDGVTREVIGPKKYPQETTMDMVTNNMSQQDIDGRNEYSDRAWNFITTYYKTVKQMLDDKNSNATVKNAAMLMKSFNDNMKGPMRAAGRLTYVPTNIDTKGFNNKNIKKLFEYEHGIPSSKMNLLIADVIFNNNKDVTLNKLKESYQVGIITKGFNDNFGRFFQDTMPFTYQYGDNPLTRWFNEFTIGGEVTELFNIQTGKIVKESVGPAKLWNSIQQAKASNEQDLSNDVVKMSMETNEDIINYAATVDAALNNARKLNAPVKKIRIFDFDDTLARSNSKVFAIKSGERVEMSAEEFANNGAQMLADGYNFDFTDFNIVRDGKPGPLLDIAKKIQAARGTEDVFVLTARAPESQGPIKDFLDSVGLNIPLSNITGLGNSTGAAKAKWVVEKAAEGYNDFYFADDAYQNVKAVRDAMSVLDVKSKVQQAKMSLEQDINKDFNDIVQEATGIRSQARYSESKGKIVGAKKGKFKFFIPYSAEDFLGLIYPILPKGKKGDSAMAWFKNRLMDPYTRAQNNLSTFRKNMMEDFKKLKEDLDVPKDLKETNESGFSNEQAVRVYIWNKQGMPIPGLSKADTKELLDIIESKPNLKEFGDQIIKLNKNFGYVSPSEGWLAGTITTDLIDGVNKNVRRKYLEEWQSNVDIIFSQENINKLEAAFGTKYVESLKNVLERMKQGKNRLATGNRLSNRILDYINNANGVVMFLNIRSAVLQTISSVNFINWNFNNPIKAGKAFANQSQYWKDFKFLMNSDFLVDRRNGLRINISENEIANAANTSGNKAQAAIAYILQKGYAPTQFADSFAIATGGATFYRNRIIDLMKNEGKTEAEAKEQAMLEFREKAEESQQSSDPMRISQQQSSDAGRLILAYANTPMQYARMQKRAFQDLANGRGDAKTNVSKIIYYGVVQNLIFNALQQAVFALGFNSEDDDEAETKKAIGVANGMADSILRGMGMGGAAVAVMKNFLLDIYQRSGRKRPEYTDSIYKLLQFSPPISSKISRLRAAAWQMDSKKRRKKAMEDFGLDNPGYDAATKVVSAVTNVPLDRLLLKMKNIDAALDEETEWWQSVAMMAGWPEWQIKGKPSKKSSKPKRKGPIKYPVIL